MRESTRMNQDPPSDTVKHGNGQQQTESAAAICYRMQPDKQILGGCSASDCHVLPTSPLAPGENRMPPCLLSAQQHSRVNLDRVTRIALMVTPQANDTVIDQAWEAVSTIRAIMKQQAVPMTVTMQTVFVRSAEEIPLLNNLFQAYYGDRMPATSYVVQPPCDGQALAIEAWALGGHGVDVQFLAADVVAVAYDDLRWIYLAGITSAEGTEGAFAEAEQVFAQLADRLDLAGATFRDVPRIWLYQGSITSNEAMDGQQTIERYRELNRSRTDFFEQQQSLGQMITRPDGRIIYPASTGIGTSGRGLTVCCMALQTDRDDVRWLPLENPRQTSAFDYSSRYSAKSPKFSRAMAVAIGDYVTTWVSGTASILNSETVHPGDVEKQTEQTIDNIQRLISPENFAQHGLPGSGAQLTDLAKLRVYVKRLEDYEKCREVCQRRFGALPTIYALADICRSDLLVEIEGVAFSQANP